MAGLWSDHFQQYGSSAEMLDGVYAQIDNWTISNANPPRPGYLHVRSNCGGAGWNHLRRILGAPKVTSGLAHRFALNVLPTTEIDSFGQCLPLLWADAGNGTQLSVQVGTDGGLILWYGDAIVGTKLVRVPPCIQAKAYNHIEGKAVIDSSAGSCEVRVNGRTVLTFAGNTQKTANTEASQIHIVAPNFFAGVGTMDVAEPMAWDDAAGNGPVDFIGNAGVLRRQLNSDTAQKDWLLSTGSTGYPLLTDHSDSTYIESDTVNDKSSFGAGNLPAGVGGVIWQEIYFRGLKTDVSNCDVAPSFVSGGSETVVTGQPMTTVETWRNAVFANDPATGMPWGISAANASDPTLTRTL